MKIVHVVLAICLVANASGADAFRYSVYRTKMLKDEAGELEISKTGLSYRSDSGETTLRISLQDIFKADVSDPQVIRIEAYDILKRRLAGRRSYSFRLREGKADEALARFLADALQRPVLGAFGSAEKDAFSIPAYHRHRFGGCHGRLTIDQNAIRFASDKPDDSRTWLYRDVEAIGSMTLFHFRISTSVETYNFDLKERLTEDAYRLAWRQLYVPSGRRPSQKQFSAHGNE